MLINCTSSRLHIFAEKSFLKTHYFASVKLSLQIDHFYRIFHRSRIVNARCRKSINVNELRSRKRRADRAGRRKLSRTHEWQGTPERNRRVATGWRGSWKPLYAGQLIVRCFTHVHASRMWIIRACIHACHVLGSRQTIGERNTRQPSAFR